MKRIINSIIFLYAAITMTAQNSFVVADKNGNSQFVQSLIFQQQQNADRFTWNSNGSATGDIKDLLFIARAQAELATANSDGVIELLEDISGTDQADAEAIAAALESNPNVEEAYSVDGDNVIVKMKDEDCYVACPMYNMESVFSEEGDMEILLESVSNSKMLMSARPSSGSDRVAIFNFFEGGSYDTKSMLAKFLKEMFENNQYRVEYYGQGYENGGTPTFTMSKLDQVISRSSEYMAIIIMSHGYKTKDGQSYFATCEKFQKGKIYDSRQSFIIDNNQWVGHSSNIKLDSNCLLYLGPCFGIPDRGYSYSNTSVIGWKDKNAISQIHAGVFFHKLLYGNASVEVNNALGCTFREDPFNPSAELYASENVPYWDFAYYRGVQKNYADGLEAVLIDNEGNNQDKFIKKTGKVINSIFTGYIDGNANEYSSFAKIQLEPIVRIQKPGEYSSKLPDNQGVELSHLAGGDFSFKVSLPFDDKTSEGIYRINVYAGTGNGWKLIIQPNPVYIIYSKKLGNNYALPAVSEEDVYSPSVLDSSGNTVEEITLYTGISMTFNVDAYRGHTLSAPCHDESVATVSISGNKLTVTGVSEGSTHFGVYDKQNRRMSLVKVSVKDGGNEQSYLNCPDNNHPHKIDLGLPSGTKWACCNVGASKPEAYGGYYAWGETEEKSDYNGWGTYIHCDGSTSTIHNIGTDISGTDYDVAHVKWGNSWVIPNYTQFEELIDNCSSERVEKNGVDGLLFTGSNGAKLFLPTAGDRPSGRHDEGEWGLYWSSSIHESINSNSWALRIYSGEAEMTKFGLYRGFSVRPVCRN